MSSSLELLQTYVSLVSIWEPVKLHMRLSQFDTRDVSSFSGTEVAVLYNPITTMKRL